MRQVHLSPRQCEILAAMAEGLQDKAIANRFGCSVHTVKAHKKCIFYILDVRNSAAAVMAGVRAGYLCDERRTLLRVA